MRRVRRVQVQKGAYDEHSKQHDIFRVSLEEVDHYERSGAVDSSVVEDVGGVVGVVVVRFLQNPAKGCATWVSGCDG